MDELIGQISAATGVDAAVARKAVGIIIDFLSREGPPEAVGRLLEKLPGARELGSAAGGGGGGLMGVFGALTGVGLGMGDIQGVARAVVDYARAKAGNETVDAVVDAIPGLGPFV